MTYNPKHVPVIPIEIEYDMMCEGYGFWDFWIGHNPCKHHEIKVEI